MIAAPNKFFASLTAVLVGLAMNLCVCAGIARPAPGAPAGEAAADASDPHACCKNPSGGQATPRPAEHQDPCESCPVKQKLGGALPEQLSKLTHQIDAAIVLWPELSPAGVNANVTAAVFDGHPSPPLLLDLFHTSCQLSC